MTNQDYRTHLAEIVSDAATAQNVDVLATDFQVQRAGNLVRLSISATAVSLRLIPSTGSAVILSAGLTLDTMTTFEFALDTGRTWNLQTDAGAGITVKHLVIAEVQA